MHLMVQQLGVSQPARSEPPLVSGGSKTSQVATQLVVQALQFYYLESLLRGFTKWHTNSSAQKRARAHSQRERSQQLGGYDPLAQLKSAVRGVLSYDYHMIMANVLMKILGKNSLSRILRNWYSNSVRDATRSIASRNTRSPVRRPSST